MAHLINNTFPLNTFRKKDAHYNALQESHLLATNHDAADS